MVYWIFHYEIAYKPHDPNMKLDTREIHVFYGCSSLYVYDCNIQIMHYQRVNNITVSLIKVQLTCIRQQSPVSEMVAINPAV